MDIRIQCNSTLNDLRENNFEPRSSYPIKLSFLYGYIIGSLQSMRNSKSLPPMYVLILKCV